MSQNKHPAYSNIYPLLSLRTQNSELTGCLYRHYRKLWNGIFTEHWFTARWLADELWWLLSWFASRSESMRQLITVLMKQNCAEVTLESWNGYSWIGCGESWSYTNRYFTGLYTNCSFTDLRRGVGCWGVCLVARSYGGYPDELYIHDQFGSYG